MTFNVGNVTVSDQKVFVVGSITELGNWCPADGISLDTTDDKLRTMKIKIPSDTFFKYKYIKKTDDGTVTWESDPNRRAASSDKCSSTSTLDDVWR